MFINEFMNAECSHRISDHRETSSSTAVFFTEQIKCVLTIVQTARHSDSISLPYTFKLKDS